MEHQGGGRLKGSIEFYAFCIFDQLSPGAIREGRKGSGVQYAQKTQEAQQVQKGERVQRKIELTLQTAALPDGIYGVCQQRGQNQYFIVLKDDQDDDKQAASFLHECLHVFHDDFNSSLPVNIIEALRHAELKRIIRVLQEEIENG